MTHVDPSSFTGPIPIQRPVRGASIWDRDHRWTTIGAVALIFLAALQSLAVTTVMPAVAADLDGHALYAVAFSGTFATSVVGMVAAGAASDRKGPVIPIWIAVLLFLAGLLIDAAATTMEMLVVGRLVMGLGSGGLVVSLYVIVARAYPSNLHGRVMASFAAAWIVPSLIGPAMAGAVTEFVHWRWVFGGVAVCALASFAMLAVRLRKLDLSSAEPTRDPVAVRLLLAIVVAGAALVLSLAGEGEQLAPGLGSWGGWLVAALAIVVIAVAMKPLVPRRTYLSGRGLPSVILMRGLVAGATFGGEIYVPYLLQDTYGFSPTWAGAGLTAAAITWAVGSETTGRIGDRLGNRRIAMTGIALLGGSCLLMMWSAASVLPVWIPILTWGVAGFGMGMMYPRLTVLSLAYSTPQNQGFNSSALQISDAVGTSSTMAVMGLVFTALAATALGFPAVFGIAGLLALIALIPGLRLGHAAETRD